MTDPGKYWGAKCEQQCSQGSYCQDNGTCHGCPDVPCGKWKCVNNVCTLTLPSDTAGTDYATCSKSCGKTPPTQQLYKCDGQTCQVSSDSDAVSLDICQQTCQSQDPTKYWETKCPQLGCTSPGTYCDN